MATVTVVAGNGFVNLSWEALDDGGFTISAFRIFRGPASGVTSFLGNSSTNHFNDTTVKNGLSYDYAVSAVNAIGEGPKSLVVPASPKGAPSAPLNLTAKAGNGYVALSWATPSDNGGSAVTIYRVYRGAMSDGSDTVQIIEAVSLEWTDSTVVNKATYYYSVTAVNDLGEGARSAIISARPVGVPSKVQDLTAKAGDSYILLRWTPPLDDGGLAIVGYRIFKGGALLKEAQSNEFNDTDLVNGQNTTYDISAYTAMGTGAGSKVSAIPWTLPHAPTGIQVIKQGKDLVLTWSKPSDSGGFPITGYRVFRGTDPNNLIELTSISGTSYTDTSVKPGNTYYYKVSATTAKGTGISSDITSIKIKKSEQGTSMLVYILVAVIMIGAVLAVVLLMLRKRRKAQPMPPVTSPPPASTPSFETQGQPTNYQQPPQIYVQGPVQGDNQQPGYPPQ
jgi:fibronectin type 3 domain-containing protein